MKIQPLADRVIVMDLNADDELLEQAESLGLSVDRMGAMLTIAGEPETLAALRIADSEAPRVISDDRIMVTPAEGDVIPDEQVWALIGEFGIDQEVFLFRTTTGIQGCNRPVFHE